ncbi:hypothetical protein V495_03477 [Pseudogymnoascus sp. VKM F-4514 (FW-929)]|nr:hypothetical protein V495_03477 [Pseudogymnoascus sp. VKM F-4514 (FW-929)]
MASSIDFSSDGLIGLDFDTRDLRYAYSNANMTRNSWPLGLDLSTGAEEKHPLPAHDNSQQQHQYQTPQHNSPTLLSDWPVHQQPQQLQQQYLQSNTMMGPQYAPFDGTFQQNLQHAPIDYSIPTTQAALEASLQMDAPFNNLDHAQDAQAMQWGLGANWQDFQNAMFTSNHGLPMPGVGRQSLGSNSPTGTYLEVHSLPSSSSDHGWTAVDSYQNFDTFQQAQNAAIFNPGQTLHLRSHSDSSQSDATAPFPDTSFGSFEDVTFPPYSPYSPESDTYLDLNTHRNCFHGESHHHNHDIHEIVSPAAAVAPVAIKVPSTRQAAGSGSTSPPPRRNSGASGKKSPTTKATKPVIRRSPSGGVWKHLASTAEKLWCEREEESYNQGHQTRYSSHVKWKEGHREACWQEEGPVTTRTTQASWLWQVPCTRIDIKDIAYFMKDWKADYERHVGRGVSVYNIKGFSENEELMWITHGYGFAIPIMAREVYVNDDNCFMIDWTESIHKEPLEFDIRTERMSAGSEGVSKEALSEYLDQHLDGPFEEFIDNYFEGTPFITEILKTAHRYYRKEKLPVIRKALKLVLAYNLTLHVTMVQHQGEEREMEGKIDDEESKFFGKTFAPVMINFQIKVALADMWRELQKDVLEELSSLYSSVYSGDRLKNWPTIFMIASILLAVWEEMQFDCHYRVPDPASVDKFCSDMETTPVGVIVGLFHAISQKLPAFTEWETRRHGQLLNNNVAVCDAMTEMRSHVSKHEAYLKSRADCRFNRDDFDCLSNKFLSKLVIRAN